MRDPYTMQLLHAERLKDIDREAAGPPCSRLARRNRKGAFDAAKRWLVNLLIAMGKPIKGSVEQRNI
jgi:hypothetical protein